MPETRQVTKIELVGYARPEISGNKLPSNRQMLESYLFHTKYNTPKLGAREAARCVVRKCAVFWDYAEIPMVKESHAITKMEKLVLQYKNMLKYGSKKETSETCQLNVSIFVISLDELFDMAHQKKVSEMKNEAAKTLLSLHRKQGRQGYLDKIIDTGKLEASTAQKKQEEEGRMDSSKQASPSEFAANGANYVYDEVEDILDVLEQMDDSDATDTNYEAKIPLPRPKKIKILDSNTTAILDRAKISNRDAARVIAAILTRAGISLEDVHLSPENVHQNRLTHREDLADIIKDNAMKRSSHILTVHWDGKQQSAPENKFQKIDRLPVLVSGQNWHQLLGVARLERGTGEGQAREIHNYLEKWSLTADVCAMVFDTTASNTGSSNGACILLEQLIGRNLLYLACRHHILELLMKTAFETSMGCTSGPEVLIFKRFQCAWESIEKTKFSPGIHDVTVQEALHRDAADILAFSETQLQIKTDRADYREFLELVVIFLGGNLPRGNNFRALGAIHHARWMSKAIYSLKMFLFRSEFQLTSQEESGLRTTCIFIVLLYQRAWFTASNTVGAPKNDLILLKQLATNATCSNSIISKTCKTVFKKLVSHLWYLSEELIALAFFDESVSLDCKIKMCQAIKTRPALDNDKKKRKTGVNDLESVEELSLDLFVTKNTIRFFEILKIDSGFLNNDPMTWETRDDFLAACKIVQSLRVTNDIAERAVALVSEYNDLLTKDENSKQNLMLIVQKLRESSSNCTRKDLKFSLLDYLKGQSSNDPDHSN